MLFRSILFSGSWKRVILLEKRTKTSIRYAREKAREEREKDRRERKIEEREREMERHREREDSL